ncbi:MAG: hypothetical protein ABL894_03280 [Hyphomicrobium sp.]
MMAVVRLLVPLGLMGFGAIAAFMGLVVILNALSNGRVSYSMMADGARVTHTAQRQAEPGLYWRTLGLAGGLPFVLGLGAAWLGRRILHR